MLQRAIATKHKAVVRTHAPAPGRLLMKIRWVHGRSERSNTGAVLGQLGRWVLSRTTIRVLQGSVGNQATKCSGGRRLRVACGRYQSGFHQPVQYHQHQRSESATASPALQVRPCACSAAYRRSSACKPGLPRSRPPGGALCSQSLKRRSKSIGADCSPSCPRRRSASRGSARVLSAPAVSPLALHGDGPCKLAA